MSNLNSYELFVSLKFVETKDGIKPVFGFNPNRTLGLVFNELPIALLPGYNPALGSVIGYKFDEFCTLHESEISEGTYPSEIVGKPESIDFESQYEKTVAWLESLPDIQYQIGDTKFKIPGSFFAESFKSHWQTAKGEWRKPKVFVRSAQHRALAAIFTEGIRDYLKTELKTDVFDSDGNRIKVSDDRLKLSVDTKAIEEGETLIDICKKIIGDNGQQVGKQIYSKVEEFRNWVFNRLNTPKSEADDFEISRRSNVVVFHAESKQWIPSKLHTERYSALCALHVLHGEKLNILERVVEKANDKLEDYPLESFEIGLENLVPSELRMLAGKARKGTKPSNPMSEFLDKTGWTLAGDYRYFEEEGEKMKQGKTVERSIDPDTGFRTTGIFHPNDVICHQDVNRYFEFKSYGRIDHKKEAKSMGTNKLSNKQLEELRDSLTTDDVFVSAKTLLNAILQGKLAIAKATLNKSINASGLTFKDVNELIADRTKSAMGIETESEETVSN